MEAALLEVGHAHQLALLGVAELVHEEFQGELVDNQQAFTQAALLSFFFALVAFVFQGDAVFLGEVFDGLGVRHLLVFHQELDGVAGSVAHEAFVDAEARADVQRRVLVVVEGADAHEVLALFAQGDEVADHIFNADGGHHAVYGLLLDHGLLS